MGVLKDPPILYNPKVDKRLFMKEFAKKRGQLTIEELISSQLVSGCGEIVIEGLDYGVRYLCNAGFTNRQSGQYDSDGYKTPIKWIESKKSNKGTGSTSSKRTLSAPILNSTLPAFYTTNKNINFSYNSNDAVFDWTLQARIYSAFSGSSILINGVDFLTIDSNSAHDTFIIKATEQIKGGIWTPGVYKIQLRKYINSNYYSDWSNWGVVKVLDYKPDTNIDNGLQGIATILSIENTLNPTFTGTYTGPAEEILTKYKFTLYDKDNNLVGDSGWLNHLSDKDTTEGDLNVSIDSHCFGIILDPENEYTVYYEGITLNNYQFKESYTFKVLKVDYNTIDNVKELRAEPDDEEGAIKVYLERNDILPEGKYRLLREEKDRNVILCYYNAEELNSTDLIFIDFTCEDNKEYKYLLQKLSISDTIEQETKSNSVKVHFEYAYLVGENKQLKLKFNNSLSSFKYNILQQKQDTLGSKYPYIFRNGYTYYAEFPVAGLITLQMDDNYNFFKKKADGYYYDNELVFPFIEASPAANIREDNKIVKDKEEYFISPFDLAQDNFYIERKFREYVERFLNNGKPKLFKSPSEGNKIVSLLNVSFSPEQRLGRMIYSFTSTGYEVAECNYENFIKNEIIKLEESKNYFSDKEKIFVESIDENNGITRADLQSKLIGLETNRMLGYEIKNIDYIYINNLDETKRLTLTFNNSFITIEPQSDFYVPVEECNNFESISGAIGQITLIIKYNIFARKTLKNISYLALAGNQQIKDKTIIDFSAGDLSIPYHDQIVAWNKELSTMDWTLDKTKGYSNLDEYSILGFQYIQILITDVEQQGKEIAKIYINKEETESNPVIFTGSFYAEATDQDLIKTLKIISSDGKPLDLNIFGIARIEYKMMEGYQVK